MNGSSKVRPARSTLVTVAVVAVFAVAVLVFRKPLVAWFAGEPMGGAAAPASSHQTNASPAGTSDAHGEPTARYSQPVVDALRTGMDASERVRALLARDQLAGLPNEARAFADALRAASSALGNQTHASNHAVAAAAAADRLAGSTALADARKAFAELSEHLFALAAADERLQSGFYVFECPMFEGGAKWLQRARTIENPYMGAQMPTCGTPTEWQSKAEADAKPGEIDHYTCSMHPSVNSKTPGTCPICGMNLTPVTKEQQRLGVVTIPPSRQQLIGVRTGRVAVAPMVQSIRAVGRFTYDESSLVDVNLKVRGWIVKLMVSKTGQRVQKGQPLFTLYSPELQNAQQDFLLATRSQALSPGDATNRIGSLAGAARQRLRLLDLTDAQIETVARTGEPLAQVTFAAPASGFVIEKDVVEGGSVEPGMRLFRIASLNKVWIEADVYEADFPRVRIGQKAAVTLDYLPGRDYEATVAYVYPSLDPQTRTGRVRLELRNQDLDLRPGMYATVQLQTDLGQRLQVPASAVVYTGPRRLVFVDLGEGRFRPQELQVGGEANGMYEVLSGLTAGDVVATSGVFLIAAEARVSTAAKYWEGTESAEVESSSPLMPADSQVPMQPQQPPSPSTSAKKRTPAPDVQSERTTPAKEAPVAPAALYTCPMHPEVQSATPGKCPKCGMDLVPMKRPEAP